MDEKLKTQLERALNQKFSRDTILFLYREQEHGASFAGLKEMLFVHEEIEECQLEGLVKEEVLAYDGFRYRLSPSARKLLDQMPELLIKEQG